jgi:hypothetical protein
MKTLKGESSHIRSGIRTLGWEKKDRWKGLDGVAHSYNPNYSGDRDGRTMVLDQSVQSSETFSQKKQARFSLICGH